MTVHTRRDFLVTTTLAAAEIALGTLPRPVCALPVNAARSHVPATAFLPDPLGAADLRALATSALEAAKAAGATYADIRVAEREEIEIGVWSVAQADAFLRTHAYFDYGIRVVVNGAEAFEYGSIAAPEALARAARQAVATAKGCVTLAARDAWVPTPAVTGEWTTPVEIDPFTVPVGTQVDHIHALQAAAGRVLGGSAPTTFTWIRERRVFGSTEGSLVMQTTYRAQPSTFALVEQTLFPYQRIALPYVGAVSGGYEIVLAPDLMDRMKVAAERAAWLSTLPYDAFELGRFPVVFDGYTTGAILGQTLGQAVQLDRAMGRDLDAAGPSYLAPPKDVLGTPVLHPHMTVTGHRKLPSLQAVRWDDDGVVPEPFTVVQDGHLVDYCTSRLNAGALDTWYQHQGQPLRSHGCAVAERACHPVQIATPHLILAPSQASISLDDLCRDVTRGLLVTQVEYLSTDRQLSSGMIFNASMFELVRGKIVRRIRDTGIQFGARALWKHLTALGDTSTVRDTRYTTWKGNPWRMLQQTATSPATLVTEVDVLTTKRRTSRE